MSGPRRIPCLVVSGFLGSGKTTLVRRLLAAARAEGVRAAVVSNEFGELGVDASLLADGAPALAEIEGGCICCALNDELYATLLALWERAAPDRIVVETSGVAVPSDVQLTFWQPPICDRVSEEAVVTVVDAAQLAEGVDREPVFREQVETADLVVLNKVDLVEPAAVPALRARLAEIHAAVPVVPAVRCDVDLRLLFAGIGRVPGEGTAPRPGAHLHVDYESVVVELPGDLDAAEVERRVRALGALRVKGHVRAGGRVQVVQGVGRRVELVDPPAPVPEDRVGRVVVIRARERGAGRPG